MLRHLIPIDFHPINIVKTICRHLCKASVLGACMLTVAICAYADPIPESIDKLLKNANISSNHVAIFAQRLDQPSPALSINANQAMNPASVMKLVTSYAGLSILGPEYRWKTDFLSDNHPVNGRLNGNLYIRGHGDPSLDNRSLWRLLGELRQQGVQAIQGNIIIDDSQFAPTQNDAFAFDGQGYRAYNATANATMIDQRATSIGFRVMDNRVQVTVFPKPTTLVVENHLRVDERPCDNWRDQLQYDISTAGKITTLAFRGAFSAQCGERFLDLSVLSPSQQWESLFKLLWSQWGGKFNGKVTIGLTPANAILLKTHESEPLSSVIHDVNKYSQNLMARQLLLSLALEQGTTPATEDAAAEIVNQWLTQRNLADDAFIIDNGAGLSRKNRLSAQWLGKLLIDAYQSPYMPEFVASLPIYAKDGTLARRPKNSPLKGRAHLKTGSVEGVNALAGYVIDQQGQTWVIVWLVNDDQAHNSVAAQEQLLNWVYQSAK